MNLLLHLTLSTMAVDCNLKWQMIPCEGENAQDEKFSG